MHLNQHDVIYLDMMEFADNKGNGANYLENLNSEVVSELKETYPDRLEKDKSYSLPEAISSLKISVSITTFLVDIVFLWWF